MRDAGSVLGPRVTITCTAGCGAQGNVSEAAGSRGAAKLPRCRGRHPHLQTFENCNEPLKLMVLGSSNLWFGVTVSALHLPEDDVVAAAIDQQWAVVSGQSSPELLAQLVRIVPSLHALVDLSPDELWSAVEAERQRRAVDVQPAPQTNLLDAEWQLLSHPTTKKQDDDFRAEPTPKPQPFGQVLEQVVQVKRLREVQAMVGFTRIDAPSQGDLDPAFRAPLSTGATKWAPAVERRGEGIFLELREPLVAAWCDRVDDHPHIDALRDSYRRWSANREIDANPDFPVARYLLVHTLSHLLLRQVALECGYSSASIRERLYVGSPAHPTAGLLLSTAASDSEGTSAVSWRSPRRGSSVGSWSRRSTMHGHAPLTRSAPSGYPRPRVITSPSPHATRVSSPPRRAVKQGIVGCTGASSWTSRTAWPSTCEPRPVGAGPPVGRRAT